MAQLNIKLMKGGGFTEISLKLVVYTSDVKEALKDLAIIIEKADMERGGGEN